MTAALPLALMALLLQFVIIYYGMYWAGSEQRRLTRINNNLLTDIARKQGVAESDIDQSNRV